MKPMLAKRYKKGKQQYPCFVQPKLNGIRGLYLGDGVMQSRSYGREEEIIWKPEVISHILEKLSGIKHCLDGELYCHGMSLQQINSRIGVKRNKAHKEKEQIGYHVFDVITNKPMHERVDMLLELSTTISAPIYFVETVYCHSDGFSDQCYNMFKKLGYEGLIYRDLNAPYGREFNCTNQENRWNCLLKRKDRQDLECEIVGVNESKEFVAIQEPHIAS